MRVAILEFNQDQKSATGVRGAAMRDYLVLQGHAVDILSPPPEKIEQFHRDRFGIKARLRRRLFNLPTLPHLWDFIADQLEPQIHRGSYDVVIGRGQDVGYVLTRIKTGSIRILDMANILFLEGYYAWGANLVEVEETYEKEMHVFNSVDYILSPHEILTKYFLQQFDKNRSIESKIITVRLGCDLPDRIARYSFPPRIAYAGSYYYIQDPYLLSYLTKISPFAIDCFGPKDPNRKFLPARLNYQGYAQTTNFLADYQYGIITVSRDALRQHSPATKFPYYFSYGLPVLFPEWMKEGYDYGKCAIPYSEDNFVDQLKRVTEREIWSEMSVAARKLAESLKWDLTLKPLGDLLQQDQT